MKVLWFSPTPCGSIRRQNNLAVFGGWLISLEDELKRFSEIDLEVAFFSEQEEIPFNYDGVRYYPMGHQEKRNLIQRVLDRKKSIFDVDRIKLSWMLDVIKQSHPDLIHIHGSEASFITILPYVKDIPVVVSIQGMIAPYTEKFFSGISMYDAFKLDSMRDRIHAVGIRDDWKSFQSRRDRECQYLSQAQYILGRTFWDYNCTLALNPQRKYFTVNEILRPPFYVHQWKGCINEGLVKIVSTISGGIYKGMETAIKTAMLLKKYSHVDFEWHIAGYDSESKWVRIAETITHLKVSNCNIVLHGKLDAEELCQQLCSSDVYVHVSHIENSPNCVCEAMLVGMPIISSYAGGTSSLLTHERDGILVQDGDPYVLAGAIINIVQHPDLAVRYGGNARNKALLRHDRKKIVDELLYSYSQVLDSFMGNS